MSGTFVSFSDSTVTYTDDAGDTQTLTLADPCSVSRNGKAAKLTDLKAGDKLAWTGDSPKSLSATGK